jgi:hypothetical protein
MNETGQDASGTFSAGSADVPPGTSMLSSGPDQGTATHPRHRRRKTRMLVAAGAVAAAVAAGVTTALLARSASDPPSPLTALTGALARTPQESYRFSLDSTVKYAGRDINSVVVCGALDPRHDLGTELLTARVAQSSLHSLKARFRFTGKYVYTWVSPGSGLRTIGRPWDKAPVPGADVLPAGDLYGFVSDQPVSPAELRGVLLRAAATVRDSGPVSGPGWTGIRYAFTAHFPGGTSVSGIAYVDQQGRARRLVTTTTQKSGFTIYRDLTLGHFGAPVPVTAPPASQVQYTGRPYWGFYF